jgi:hypothetical protein
VKDVEAYKTIKVPLWVYENAKQVELLLLRKGLGRLPETVLEPAHCPNCKSELQLFQQDEERLRLRYDYLRCSHCGYTQPRFEASGEPSLGTAIGIGLVYLLNTMFGNGRSSAQRELGTGQAN